MGRPIKQPQVLIGIDHTTPSVIAHIGQDPNFIQGLFKTESNFEGVIGLTVSWSGGNLTTAPLIEYRWSPDETTFFLDNSAPSYCTTLTPGPAGSVDLGPYLPPRSAKAVHITVTNKDAGRDIRVLALGGSIDYTIGGFGFSFGSA